MKFTLLIFAGIFISLTSFFTQNEKINNFIQKGLSEYNQENYYTSALYFDTLQKHYQLNSEALQWNMANAWLKSSESDSALIYFEKLTLSPSLQTRSRAFNQIGLIQYFNGLPEEAELAFIESLKNDHTNSIAKYNLELLQKINLYEDEDSTNNNSSQVKTLNQKKVATEKKIKKTKAFEIKNSGNEKKQLNQTKRPKAELNNKGSEPNNSNTKEDNDEATFKSRKFNSNSLDQQEALKILETMKQNEIKYLQQIKKRSKESQEFILPQY